MKTGTTTSEARQGLTCSDLLSALRYVANESQRNPMESVRDMCNEAFDRYKIPMTAQWSGNDDHPIKFITDNVEVFSGYSEIICTKCGIREQKGEQPEADF